MSGVFPISRFITANAHIIAKSCRNCRPNYLQAHYKVPMKYKEFRKMPVFSRFKHKFALTPIIRKLCQAVAAKSVESSDKMIGYWLLTCSGMVFGAVIIGGLTRLTESGLSMVEWRLIKDMAPPANELEWVREFDKYKSYPEYAHKSDIEEMTLANFKFIWYMEYIHRMWGRAVGMVFLVPAAVFVAKGMVKRPMKIRMAIYASLIGFQGFLGWYMVKSGLCPEHEGNAVPRVSQYRLAAHLSTALVLYALFLWQGLSHLLPHQYNPRPPAISRLYKFAHANHGLVFLTCVAGAFVAGLDAGLVYNTWPKMADRWIPGDLLSKSPKWRNFFENATMTQFIHRLLGQSLVLMAGGVWWVSRSAPLTARTRLVLNCLVTATVLQAGLGISTLLNYVPTWLAACHQGGAMTVFTAALWLSHECRKLPK